MFDQGSASWVRVRGRLIRVLDQLDHTDKIPNHRDMDSQVVTVDLFVVAIASI